MSNKLPMLMPCKVVQCWKASNDDNNAKCHNSAGVTLSLTFFLKMSDFTIDFWSSQLSTRRQSLNLLSEKKDKKCTTKWQHQVNELFGDLQIQWKEWKGSWLVLSNCVWSILLVLTSIFIFLLLSTPTFCPSLANESVLYQRGYDRLAMQNALHFPLPAKFLIGIECDVLKHIAQSSSQPNERS